LTQNFVTKIRVFGAANSTDFVILACVVLIQIKCDGRTDGQTPRRWLKRAKHYVLSRVKNKKKSEKNPKIPMLIPINSKILHALARAKSNLGAKNFSHIRASVYESMCTQMNQQTERKTSKN